MIQSWGIIRGGGKMLWKKQWELWGYFPTSKTQALFWCCNLQNCKERYQRRARFCQGKERLKEEIVPLIVTAFKTVSSLLNFDFLMITSPYTQLGAKYQCGQNYQEVTKFPVLSSKMIGGSWKWCGDKHSWKGVKFRDHGSLGSRWGFNSQNKSRVEFYINMGVSLSFQTEIKSEKFVEAFLFTWLKIGFWRISSIERQLSFKR